MPDTLDTHTASATRMLYARHEQAPDGMDNDPSYAARSVGADRCMAPCAGRPAEPAGGDAEVDGIGAGRRALGLGHKLLMARKGGDPNWRSKEILPEGWIDQAGLCSDCRKAPPRDGQSYCVDCHNRRAREWRKTHALTGDARDKANSRSYAGVYKRRGHLIPQPCK